MTPVEEPFPPCGVDGGCSYLRELSKLERLVGCDLTAKFYERTAQRCSEEGCWALLLHLRQVSSPIPPPRLPFPLRANRPLPQPKLNEARGHTGQVVPFMRDDVADVVRDEEGNFVERRALKVEFLDRTEPLGYMYDYWRWLRSMTRCQLSNVDTMHLMRAGIIGKLHVVDVKSGDPDDFRFDLFGYGVPFGTFEAPRQFPIAIYAEAVLRDYNTARLAAVPRLQRVRARLGGVHYDYVRLLLPLFEERGRVSRLLAAVHREVDDGTLVERLQKDSFAR